GVVGQVHGRDAVVALVHVGQRVLERHVVELLALGGGDDLACDAPALQALLHEGAGHDEQASLGVHQAVFQLGVDVERLVGGNGPRGRRPDNDERGLGQGGQAEGGG